MFSRTVCWRLGALLTSLLCLAGPAVRGAEAPTSKEYQLKAVYLFNFTKYVEWPEQRFSDRQSPIIIGVLGHNPFGGELREIVRDRTINGRPLLVRLITTAEQAQKVHVLFVPAGEEARPEYAETRTLHLALLTAGESVSFSAGGGMITFTHAADRLRFTINLESADRAGLKLSAQLLKLATMVHPRP